MFVCGGPFLSPRDGNAGGQGEGLKTSDRTQVAREPKKSKHANTKKAVPSLSILGNGFFCIFAQRLTNDAPDRGHSTMRGCPEANGQTMP